MEMSTENARRSGAESVTNAELVMSQLAGNTGIVKQMALGVQESCQNASVSIVMSLTVVVLTVFSMQEVKLSHNNIIFSFLAIQCEVPANPENGRAVYASVSYNSLISYECTYGYMLIGDSVRRCERNKEWTGKQPHCKGNTQIHSKRISMINPLS